MQQPEPGSIFHEGIIADVVVTELRKFTDERGWLTELFRHDQLAAEFHPAMGYLSMTEPGVTRGPHEHSAQADLFCFLGPGNFKLRLWDNRPAAPTYRYVMTLIMGADNPAAVLIPKGIVHAYKNLSQTAGATLNFPNALYKGVNYSEPIDEIRHEDDPDTIFILNNTHS